MKQILIQLGFIFDDKTQIFKLKRNETTFEIYTSFVSNGLLHIQNESVNIWKNIFNPNELDYFLKNY